MDPIPLHIGGEDVEDDTGDADNQHTDNQSPTHDDPAEEIDCDSGRTDDDEEQYHQEPQLRRSDIIHMPSTRYSSAKYILLGDRGEPETYAEALTDADKKEWLKATREEMQSLHENHTYKLGTIAKR